MALWQTKLTLLIDNYWVQLLLGIHTSSFVAKTNKSVLNICTKKLLKNNYINNIDMNV